MNKLTKNVRDKDFKQNQAGMALVTTIIFAAIGIIAIVAGITMTSTTSQSNQQFLQGQQALIIAESGAENALLRLLRNPDYQQETLTIGGRTARIEVTEDLSTKNIEVVGEYKLARRKIKIITSDESGMLTINSWEEIE